MEATEKQVTTSIPVSTVRRCLSVVFPLPSCLDSAFPCGLPGGVGGGREDAVDSVGLGVRRGRGASLPFLNCSLTFTAFALTFPLTTL